jgi:hypothetical protein
MRISTSEENMIRLLTTTAVLLVVILLVRDLTGQARDRTEEPLQQSTGGRATAAASTEVVADRIGSPPAEAVHLEAEGAGDYSPSPSRTAADVTHRSAVVDSAGGFHSPAQ